MDWRSVDWQSLTFIGERHEIALRLTGAEARAGAQHLAEGLADAEFNVPGQIVADAAVVGRVEQTEDGSVVVNLEVLTIAE